MACKRYFFLGWPILLMVVQSLTLSAQTDKTYYLQIDAKGNPIFTQVIQWEGDLYAREYRLILRDQAGLTLLEVQTVEPRYQVHLTPGVYTYRIISYNLLGKAEVESDWIELTILKAEQPVISSVSPQNAYMDSFDGRITILGTLLQAEGTVTMVSAKGKKSLGKVTARKNDGEITVVFPDDAYEPGQNSISFENPGGLSSSLKDCLSVQPQRPLDILIQAGYPPFIALFDDWYVQNWSTTFNPIAVMAQIDVFFVKQYWGYLGTELAVQWRRSYGGQPDATLTSDFVMPSLSLAFKYRFTKDLHGLLRLGGGLAWSHHSFDYSGFNGPSTSSWDPFAQAGIAIQYFLPFKLYGELGVDLNTIFLKDDAIGGLSPRLSIGYQVF